MGLSKKLTEAQRESWRKYAASEKGVMTLLLNNAADRAKRYGLKYSLDREWLKEKLGSGKCELSGIKFERGNYGKYRAHPFGPSIDRMCPKEGYTKENCRLICFCVNMARSDWGDEVLIQMSKGIINEYNK